MTRFVTGLEVEGLVLFKRLQLLAEPPQTAERDRNALEEMRDESVAAYYACPVTEIDGKAMLLFMKGAGL